MAGLPWWELLIARRLLFPDNCWSQDWAAASRPFQAEGARILAVWDAMPPEQLPRRVLVKRIAGMEDSSQFWSVAMTVEHLNKVNDGICWVLATLPTDGDLNRQVKAADFKPQGLKEPSEVRAAFVASLAEAAKADTTAPSRPRGQGRRFSHPWFGPLDAHQWNCLRSFHQTIHRKQIEAIRKGLGVA